MRRPLSRNSRATIAGMRRGSFCTAPPSARMPRCISGKREERGIRHQDDVAGNRNLHAAADRRPVQRGNDRFLQVEILGDAGKSARTEAFFRIVVVVEIDSGGRRLLEIPAGTEDALAGSRDQAAGEVGIVLQGMKGLVHGATHRAIDRVRRRAIHHDLQNLAVPPGEDEFLRHSASPARYES
jgi:hypothetical protein